MARWPRDNQAEFIRFYGTPGKGGTVEQQLVRVTPPFRMYYEGRPVASFFFHRKAAPALMAALNEIWEVSGHDQAKLDRLGVSRFDGTYVPRKVRGSSTKWSNHAFGAAIDINAQDNGFNTGKGTMPKFVIDAFKRQGARWGGDYKSRTDPMHFEFCCDQGVQVASLGDFTPELDEDITNDFAPEHASNYHDGGLDVPSYVPVSDSPPVVDSYIFSRVKSAFRSKISWILGALGVSQGAVITDDSRFSNALLSLVTNPRFLWLVIIVILVAAGWYFYWKDHGKGSV